MLSDVTAHTVWESAHIYAWTQIHTHQYTNTCTNMNICPWFSNLLSGFKIWIIRPFLQSLISSLSFHRRKVIWHSKVICKGDWWLTIDVPIPSRQQHFIQLCWEYKHDRNNNGRITNTIKKRRRSGGRQVTRMKLTKEDRWQQAWTEEDAIVSIVGDVDFI